MKNPCYDATTKTDCPRRKAACAVTCPEWAAYLKERDKVYTARKEDNAIAETIINNIGVRLAKVRARRSRNGWYRKNYKD
jgi:hypothetical protein